MLIIVTPKALKEFNSLPVTEKQKIKKKLKQLETNPLAGKKLTGKLSDLRSLRAWPYRIIYYEDKKPKRIFVTAILHRQGVYK